MTYSVKVCVETEELFLVLVKQQLHELLVDRLQLLVGVQRGEQILAILVDDLQDHQAVVGIVLVFPLGLGGEEGLIHLAVILQSVYKFQNQLFSSSVTVIKVGPKSSLIFVYPFSCCLSLRGRIALIVTEENDDCKSENREKAAKYESYVTEIFGKIW